MRDQGDTAPMLVVYGAGLTGELVVLPRARAEAPGHAVRRAPRRNDLGRASRAFTAATYDEIVTRRDRDEEGVSPRQLPMRRSRLATGRTSRRRRCSPGSPPIPRGATGRSRRRRSTGHTSRSMPELEDTLVAELTARGYRREADAALVRQARGG